MSLFARRRRRDRERFIAELAEILDVDPRDLQEPGSIARLTGMTEIERAEWKRAGRP